ncbi:unnamed protein product [Periconia digitata]|uniref:Cytochrome P450 n=1 Tax=Periconia digitata TaxID=1303443 RepID=A0A9W4UU68_9PLEO|nr:unnamed protein product [Periconia digitata]
MDFTIYNLAILLAAVVPSVLLHRIVKSYTRLSHVPGPFFCHITNLKRVYWVLTGQAHLHHQRLHSRHGPVVRTGPNSVFISNPDDVPAVYPVRAGFPKADFYKALQPYSPNKGTLPSLFSIQDEAIYRTMKNPIVPVFAPANVMKYEVFVDQMLQAMSAKFDIKAAGDELFDLGEWLMYFAFDVMGLMTFSKTYGFVESGNDVDGRHNTIFTYFKGAAPWTQITWLDQWVNKNHFLMRFRKTPGMAILGIVHKSVQERLKHGKGSKSEDSKDMLDNYLTIQQNNSAVPDWAPQAWVYSNVVAGSDSVGTVMQTFAYNLLTDPRTTSALISELRSASLSKPFPKYSEVRNLPYLDACVNEAVRMHPPFCLPLERVVPEGGVTISGVYLPGGTNVGGNGYVVNRNEEVFGSNVDEWRPERWLECSPEQKSRMSSGMLTFGAGRRSCMGKYIAVMEIKKLMPFLLLNYEMKIPDPKTHSVECAWFFKHKGILAQIRKRTEEEIE